MKIDFKDLQRIIYCFSLNIQPIRIVIRNMIKACCKYGELYSVNLKISIIFIGLDKQNSENCKYFLIHQL